MLEANIKQRVDTHYKNSKDPLLLSQFGKLLRVEGLWPVEGESRSLLKVIEELQPAVSLIRDPGAPAFTIVVAQGYESIAHEAIRARQPSSVPLFIVAGLPKAISGQAERLKAREKNRCDTAPA